MLSHNYTRGLLMATKSIFVLETCINFLFSQSIQVTFCCIIHSLWKMISQKNHCRTKLLTMMRIRKPELKFF